jgi:hypothetical protein
MQTFLVSSRFRESASLLDSRRLNKQLLEGRQILGTLAHISDGWKNHPAIKMWEGHPQMLGLYLTAIKDECVKRSIKTDKNWTAISELLKTFRCSASPPHWWVDMHLLRRIIITHRANLYLKDPVYYERFKRSVTDYRQHVCCERCNYFWPTHLENYNV